MVTSMYIQLNDNSPYSLMDRIALTQMATAIMTLHQNSISFLPGEIFTYTLHSSTDHHQASVLFKDINGVGVHVTIYTEHQTSEWQWLLGEDQIRPLNHTTHTFNGYVEPVSLIDKVALVNRAIQDVVQRHLMSVGKRE